MSKKLTITYDGIDYVLEYTRNSVREMEERGFRAGDLKNKPMSGWLELFGGAFICHHKRVNRNLIEEIFYHTSNRDALMDELADMYIATVDTLFDEPAENEKNAVWKTGD